MPCRISLSPAESLSAPNSGPVWRPDPDCCGADDCCECQHSGRNVGFRRCRRMGHEQSPQLDPQGPSRRRRGPCRRRGPRSPPVPPPLLLRAPRTKASAPLGRRRPCRQLPRPPPRRRPTTADAGRLLRAQHRRLRFLQRHLCPGRRRSGLRRRRRRARRYIPPTVYSVSATTTVSGTVEGGDALIVDSRCGLRSQRDRYSCLAASRSTSPGSASTVVVCGSPLVGGDGRVVLRGERRTARRSRRKGRAR